MTYTDDTILMTGKYKFIRLCLVPPDYLLDLYKNKKGIRDKLLAEYIENNLIKIQQRKAGLVMKPPLDIGAKTVGNRKKIVCKKANGKIIFISKKDANRELDRIAAHPSSHKKPIRSYECEHCGGWHLTSKPKRDG